LKAIRAIHININEQTTAFEEKVEKFCLRGSGWRVHAIHTLVWRKCIAPFFAKGVGHSDSKKILLSDKLKAKKAVINISGFPDGECFK